MPVELQPRHADLLETLYERYTYRRHVQPDPVQYLYAYDDARDREVVALIAATLAYGRVAHIMRSVGRVLDPMGDRPAAWLDAATDALLARTFDGFRHRFTAADDLVAMLAGARDVRRCFGSLEACFAAGYTSDGAVHGGLTHLSDALADAGGRRSFLLADPRTGSACKRWHLLLRWLVRCDCVDVGQWRTISPADLHVPLDVHMHRLARQMGLTRRKSPDGRAVTEVTAAYRRLRPDDPVRYDYALTHLGMAGGRLQDAFVVAWNGREVADA